MKLASDNPIRFLCKTESRFFGRDGGLVSISKNLERFDGMQAFADEVRDALRLREIEFKQSRYYDR